jgi:hypothetical protein
MTTTPRPRHGWVSEPTSPGYWWAWFPEDNRVHPKPLDIAEPLECGWRFPKGTLWHPCTPPEPPVL